nr:hypothetical protein CPGR_05601 [Mycolicibacter nonchromogenicus]
MLASGWIDEVIATPWAKSSRSGANTTGTSSEFVRVSSPRRGERFGSDPVSRSLCSSRCVPSEAAANTTCRAVKSRLCLRTHRPVRSVLTT